ncbi:MAG: hypothetical protein BGO31_19670 [Bacteroidetes bacterium 43-16]|nr:MAG: hypothetical protein BGO31_19670 [Bacteroidetes bacterium 43-16]
MKTLKPIAAFLLSITLLAIMLTACKKDGSHSSCFDKKLYEEYKDKACPENCPGVIGCDGKEYCNACIAATQGIRAQ